DDTFLFTGANYFVDRSGTPGKRNVHSRLNVTTGGFVNLPAKGRQILAVHRRDASQLFGLFGRHLERGVVKVIRSRRAAFPVYPYRDGDDRVLAASAGCKPVGGEAKMREVF